VNVTVASAVGEADGVRVRVGLCVRVDEGMGSGVNEAVGSAVVASGVREGDGMGTVGSGAGAGLDRVEETAQHINRMANRSNNVRRIGVIIAGMR
jgi:hypothetical protein